MNFLARKFRFKVQFETTMKSVRASNLSALINAFIVSYLQPIHISKHTARRDTWIFAKKKKKKKFSFQMILRSKVSASRCAASAKLISLKTLTPYRPSLSFKSTFFTVNCKQKFHSHFYFFSAVHAYLYTPVGHRRSWVSDWRRNREKREREELSESERMILFTILVFAFSIDSPLLCSHVRR